LRSVSTGRSLAGGGRLPEFVVAGALALRCPLGGAPFGEDVLLWWNFVGRSTEEMAAARQEWEGSDGRGRRFGEVRGYDGPRLVSPELTTRLRAR